MSGKCITDSTSSPVGFLARIQKDKKVIPEAREVAWRLKAFWRWACVLPPNSGWVAAELEILAKCYAQHIYSVTTSLPPTYRLQAVGNKRNRKLL